VKRLPLVEDFVDCLNFADHAYQTESQGHKPPVQLHVINNSTNRGQITNSQNRLCITWQLSKRTSAMDISTINKCDHLTKPAMEMGPRNILSPYISFTRRDRPF
jgi:hypothetical protein